jgi:mRNA-degrading endonuclease RelE of RelBE toxin-antitoxin system
VLSDEAKNDCSRVRDEKLRSKLRGKLKRYSEQGIALVEKNVKTVNSWDGEMRYRLRINGERVLFFWSKEHDTAFVLRVFTSHDDYERYLSKQR